MEAACAVLSILVLTASFALEAFAQEETPSERRRRVRAEREKSGDYTSLVPRRDRYAETLEEQEAQLQKAG
jgi:hypothetical protein